MMGFEQAMHASGLLPRAVIADSKWRRCATVDKPKKRNGAYVLHPDGRGYWRNWALDGDINAWSDGGENHAAPIDLAAVARRRAAERDERVRAVREARAAWSAATALRWPHPYLERKGLSAVGCAGLRAIGTAIAIPVLWDGRVTSVQTIAPDGQKRFWKGAPVKGGSYTIKREKSAVTAVCEGFATGLAIFQAVRHASVVVAFDAGNLLPVVDRLRPKGAVVICADDDHATQAKRGINPGREKAANAAELIGAGVAWPEGIEGTDWADALLEWGDGAHKRIERQILAKARYVT